MIRKVAAIVLALVIAAPSLARSRYEAICKLSAPHTGGSGTMIAANRSHCLVLTCAHLPSPVGARFSVKFPGYNSVEGMVVKSADAEDLALILAPRPGQIRPVKLGVTDRKHEPFWLFGYPQGDRDRVNWQHGRATLLVPEILEVDCAPIGGMSGGPTLDSRGYLVGVVVGKAVPGERIGGRIYRGPERGYVVPSGTLFPFLLEFVEETKMTCSEKFVTAAALAAAVLATAPDEVHSDDFISPEFSDACVVYDPVACCNRNCRGPLLHRFRPQPRFRSRSPRRNWQKPQRQSQPKQRRTQPIEIEGNPRSQGGCPNGQCERPRDSRFELKRETPRRSFEIEVQPDPETVPQKDEGPKDEGAPDALVIQVQDIEPIPRDGGPEPTPAEPKESVEDSVADETVEEEADDRNAELAAIVGALVAAFQAYVRKA